MAPSKPCGQHTELVSNNALRVTKCGCGTIHMTVVASGVTMRMSQEVFRGAAAGMKSAVERLDETPHLGGATIN